MQARVVDIPSQFPPKWDLADTPPPGANLTSMLEAAKLPQSRLRRFITSAADLAKREIPPRESVVDPWLPTSSLSMFFAARGIGKTWFALSLTIAICRGEDFLSFEVPRPRTVLYVDGEMALADLQDRLKSLDASPPKNMFLLPSESLFRENRPLNINAPEDQQAIAQAIEDLRSDGHAPEVVVFDNLSSLSGGIDENDNSALDVLLKWLISLRHKGLAVILVHHAGKSGDQRGASRREDLLDTSIKLSKPKDDDGEDALAPHDGAHFIAEFVKTRGRAPKPSKMELRLGAGQHGTLEWLMSHGIPASAWEQTLRAIALNTPKTPQVAQLRGLGKSAISQHCKALRKKGYLDEHLSVTTEGLERLLTLWPDLAQRLATQDDLPF